MSDTTDWRYDYLQPENAKYFSNPQAVMRPEDYAPPWYQTDDADPGDIDREPDGEGEDDE